MVSRHISRIFVFAPADAVWGDAGGRSLPTLRWRPLRRSRDAPSTGASCPSNSPTSPSLQVIQRASRIFPHISKSRYVGAPTKENHEPKELCSTAGGAALWNFSSLHMKSKGLTPKEIGFLAGVPPFLGIISTVLTGTGVCVCVCVCACVCVRVNTARDSF